MREQPHKYVIATVGRIDGKIVTGQILKIKKKYTEKNDILTKARARTQIDYYIYDKKKMYFIFVFSIFFLFSA